MMKRLRLIFFALFGAASLFGALAGVMLWISHTYPTAYVWRESTLDRLLDLELVVDGFRAPIAVSHAGDGSGRLFVVEREGRILVVQNGEILPEPFLDIREQVADEAEQGLFTIAFHPSYAENGRTFIYYTAQPDGRSVLEEYRLSSDDPNRLDPEARLLLEVAQPPDTHNGGQIAFGPDGYLYVGLGFGGLVGDPTREGQNRHSLLGTILRIDVDAGSPYGIPPDNPFADGRRGSPEVWAYGIRNPFHFSFDRETGRLFVGDVGEDRWEEVDLIEPGLNYGWHLREGTQCVELTVRGRLGCVVYTFLKRLSGEKVVAPIFEYPHAQFYSGDDKTLRIPASVTGGYVYRGEQYPELQGRYFFGDFVWGKIWTLSEEPDGSWVSEEQLDTDLLVVSFGEDEQGELYVTDMGRGGLYRIVQRE